MMWGGKGALREQGRAAEGRPSLCLSVWRALHTHLPLLPFCDAGTTLASPPRPQAGVREGSLPGTHSLSPAFQMPLKLA